MRTIISFKMAEKEFCGNRKFWTFFTLGFTKEKTYPASKSCRNGCSLNRPEGENYLKPLSYFSLFQYSTSFEKVSIFLAILLAVLSGCVPPVVNVLYGEFCNMMLDRQFPTDAPSTKTFLLEFFGGGRILQNASSKERRKALEEDSMAWGLGCGFLTFLQFLFSMVSVFLLSYMASRQISRIKILFFKSVLCKDLTWFDTRMDGNFAGKASDNLKQLESGIGALIGTFTYLLVIFGFGVIVPLLYGWKLTLAIVSAIPLSFGTTSVVAKVKHPKVVAVLVSHVSPPPHVLHSNLYLTENGMADLLSVFTFQLAIGIVNLLISFLHGWLLSLVLLIFIIPVFVSVFYKAKLQSRLAVKEMEFHSKAGTVAEEVFTSIRTVAAFEGEEKEIERYSKNLEKTKTYGIKRGVASGIGNGITWFVIYCSYAVAFVLGVRLVQHSRENGNEEYTPAVLLIVFFGIVTALTNMGFAAAHIETFSLACGAAASIFEVIRTKSQINPCAAEGFTPKSCNGEIEFRNVHFEYPSRSSVKVLRGLNLRINAGEIVAIVGGSGAGKSTVLQLVQRLYDPSQGEIFLDGQNLKSLRVSWLREQLGVVGQEPLLFGTSIRENIAYGRLWATNADVVEAAEKANAHDFIVKLKDGYNTLIGQKGSTLSGGQKQRIAIARALIRNPKILLLDEATSALDATSEKIVQAALDRAAQGRTTLIVTHRLSTIVNADRIVVLSNGVVAEEGTHDQLLDANGLYKQLLESQEENVKEKKKPPKEASETKIVHEENPILPPGPRGRYSSLPGLQRGPPKERSLKELDQYKSVSYFEVIRWGRPEWGWLFLGSLASIVGGAALPIVCVLFGDLFGLLSLTDEKFVLKQTDIYGIILMVVGITAGICMFLQMYCFTIVEMKLTTRLRVKAFSCIIRQEIGYFDDEKNKVGALCLRLSRDPTGIQGSVGSRIGVLMQAFSTMTIGTILSLFFNWKITLVTLAMIPFVFSGVAMESIFSRGISSLETKSMENASKIAVEVISNIKAVASLSRELFFAEKYSQAVKEGRKNNIKKSCLRGFAFAIGQTAPFFGYAVTLWYGGLLVANENLHYKYVVTVSELLIFGAWTLGQSVVMAPSFREAKTAAGRLNYIFLRQPHVADGESRSSPYRNGAITFSKVDFAYPTRPGITVLRGFSASFQTGKSVAIMGPSGSGKSTVVQLLQRLYDPTSGSVSIGGVNIKEYKLSSLRKVLGLVSQEPVLFDRTIHENIAYGDNSRAVPSSEVVEAAAAANIHSFISSLPLGYETKLGSAGTQLSGGQKQRIAIARALVRNPQILLLDEATSALDPQSESVVQEALDRASSGRTTITIAHRLGAVRNADVIYVVDRGTIGEFGTHEELMSLQGIYHSMHGGDSEEDKVTTPGTSKK